MHLAPGDQFGRYTIEDLLGEGGMGTVYRAVDTKLERRVALKLLRVDTTLDSHARASGAERMLREARAAAAIEHANAVGIHDVGEVGDTPYIAMELVVGRSLRSYVGDTTVPLATRLRWLTDAARALEAAHARGLVHRDVKPDNVMIREDGTVKVLDFGIAWMQSSSPASSDPAASGPKPDVPPWYVTLATLAGGPLQGTPRYMAPEQLRGGSVDGRVDQFAWGVMAYELLAGAPPWRGGNVSLTMLADVLENDPAPLRAVAPRVSAEVERIVLRTLAKEPEIRFASMGALVAALEKATGKGPGASRRALLIGGSVALTAAGLGAAWLVTRPAPAVPATIAAPVAPSARPTMDTSAEPPDFVAHFDAAEGVTRTGASVDRWADQSGRDNDALPGRRHPTWVDAAIGGRPAMHFEHGAYFAVADSAPLQFGTRSFTVEIVARHDRPPASDATGYGIATAYGCLLVKSEPPGPYRGISMMLNYPRPVFSNKFVAQTQYDHYVPSTSDGLNDGVARLFTAHRFDGTLEVRINGAVEASIDDATDDVSAAGTPMYLGAHPTDAGVIQQMHGDIAEVIVIRGGVTAQRLQQLEQDLMKKYDIVPAARLP